MRKWIGVLLIGIISVIINPMLSLPVILVTVLFGVLWILLIEAIEEKNNEKN